MKQRLVSALVTIALVLLTACGSNLPGVSTSPQGVTFISKQSPLVVSLLTSWQQKQPQVEKALKTFLGKQNLDYKKDIQPWLGSEITLAVTDLDFDHDASNGVQPGYLLIATTKDRAKSREFLQTWLSQKLFAGKELAFMPYKGIQLIYPQEAASENLGDGVKSGLENHPASSDIASTIASTVVGDRFVLIANHPQVLRQAINNAQAVDLSLANSPSYQKTMESLEQSRLGWGFINLPAVTAWLGKHGELTQEPPFDSLAIAISAKNQGLVANTALITGNPNPISEGDLESNVDGQAETSPTNLDHVNLAANYLPASSGLAIAGTDLHNFLAEYVTTIDTAATPSAIKEPSLLATGLGNLLNKVNNELNLDFQQDILPWLTGDYALSWLPRKDSGVNSGERSPSGDWLFVADRSTSSAQEAIAHLDQLATKQGFSLTPLKLAEQPVTIWTQLQTKNNKQGLKDLDTLVRGVHGQVGDYEIFASDIGAMGAALGLRGKPLPTDKRFQEAIASLTTPNQGYIYLDWLTARPFLESQFPLLRFLEVPLEPLLDNLGTLSFTSYDTKAGITSSELFLNLQKK